MGQRDNPPIRVQTHENSTFARELAALDLDLVALFVVQHRIQGTGLCK